MRRSGLRFRGNANSTNSSPRNWNGNNAVSNSTNRNYGCSAKASNSAVRFFVTVIRVTVARTCPEAANTQDLRGGGTHRVSATGKRPMAQPEPREN